MENNFFDNIAAVGLVMEKQPCAIHGKSQQDFAAHVHGRTCNKEMIVAAPIESHQSQEYFDSSKRISFASKCGLRLA